MNRLEKMTAIAGVEAFLDSIGEEKYDLVDRLTTMAETATDSRSSSQRKEMMAGAITALMRRSSMTEVVLLRVGGVHVETI